METKITRSIKRQFVKDYNLPIKLFDDEIFAYYIDLYDKLFNTKYKYYLLETLVSRLGGEQGFMHEFSSIKDEIIADISSKPVYAKLAEKDSVVVYTPKYQIPDQNIYTRNFDGKTIISIDIRKANFNALKYFDRELVNNAKDYEEFISKYTAESYMKESKQLRQVIFGNLLPKKQQSIEKNIIHKICDNILDCFDVKLGLAGTDEILILDPPDTIIMDLMSAFSTDAILDMIKLDVFKIIHIHPEKPFYAKVSETKVEFKNVPGVYYPQIYKHYFKMPLVEKDFLFEYEGETVRFVNPLYPEV